MASSLRPSFASFSRCASLVLLAGALTSCAGPLPGEEGSNEPSTAGANRVDQPVEAVRSAGIVVGGGPAPVPVIDPRKSLIVTDRSILAGFSLSAVLPRLVPQDPGVKRSALQMFQQLWDTYNQGPVDPLAPHCNQNPAGGAAPVQCARVEGLQATDSTLLSLYVPTALVNRVDLMPADGRHCGEYRIIYARTDGKRAFVIFEGALPNPNPAAGRAGCVAVQQFWRNLSNGQNASSRATALQQFYFTGLPGFSPVLHPANYGASTLDFGQVRTNVFQDSTWNLREFKIRPVCPSGVNCQSVFVPTNVKVTPLATLFTDATDARTTSFHNEFITKVAGLAVNDVNRFNYIPSTTFNLGDHNSQDFTNLYQTRLGPLFSSRIQAELTRIGSTLTPANIAARAEALSCGGCHQLSTAAPNNALGGGVTFPASLGFVHVSEFTEVGPDGDRFRISPALDNVFLPQRKAVMESFLAAP
jgi:hypothetical protein